MVLYPFLRLWTTSPAKAHFPRNLDVKSANNSGTTHSGEKTIPYYGMQLCAWPKNTTFCSYTIYSIPPYEHGAYLKPRRSERTWGGSTFGRKNSGHVAVSSGLSLVHIR